MRLVKLLAALFPKFYASLHEILSLKVKELEPKDFLQEVIRVAPDELHVRVVGPSMIATFEFLHGGVVYSTSFYQGDGLMPEIYRALLHAADETVPRGQILMPLGIISDYHTSVARYLGPQRMRAALRSLSTEHFDAEA